jgi:alkanesulfonate monooxygenase SsuD/methylene tetrahydromethanopterin reductase-like flavin-dependent oxidoreductase (luciferase family)
MKFGLFYELQLPRPWQPDDEHQLYKNTLDQIELADRLGFDCIWTVEHHFLEEYSHCSSPEVLLAAASQRTSRIRLGHGIVQLPNEINPTARVAERIAALDLLSDGRVEFGTGEGSSVAELHGFGVDWDSKRDQWTNNLDAVTRMMVEEPFAGWESEWLTVPPRNVVPKPRQKPHPPLWVACSQPPTIQLAASKGIGALSFAFLDPTQAKTIVDSYYATITSGECDPAGFAINANVAIVLPLMCHDDEQTALDRGLQGSSFFGFALGHYYVFGTQHPGKTDIWSAFINSKSTGFGDTGSKLAKQELGDEKSTEKAGEDLLRGAIGTPTRIREVLERYEAAGVDQVIFLAQAGRTRHEHICESLELFARTVMPEFAEREPAGEKAKNERIGDALQAAMKKKAPPRQVDPDYSFVAAGRL